MSAADLMVIKMQDSQSLQDRIMRLGCSISCGDALETVMVKTSNRHNQRVSVTRRITTNCLTPLNPADGYR